MTHKSITEFVCVLSKIKMYEIIDKELPEIINNFNILFPDNTSLLIFNKLVFEHKPNGNKAYDYDIASVMLANNINKIVTINGDDFKKIKEISVISNK